MKRLTVIGLALAALSGCDASPDHGGFGARMPGDVRGDIDAGSAGGLSGTDGSGTAGSAGHLGGSGGHLGAGGSGAGGMLASTGGAPGSGGSSSSAGGMTGAGGSIDPSSCEGSDCSGGGGSADCRAFLGQGLFCRNGAFATTCLGCTCDQSKTCFTMPYQSGVACTLDSQCASGNCWSSTYCEPQGFGAGDTSAAPHCTSLGWIPSGYGLCYGGVPGLTAQIKTKFGFVCGTGGGPPGCSGINSSGTCPPIPWVDCRAGDVRTVTAQVLLVQDCSECS